ncbi:leucine-rich repeat domain-containing protein [Eisenibacter elegans]|uniref:leucine-rich repeat domain-containing protein n=1 Tax=Eisenibacter elegans TaxID=997 RepID=UPI000422B21E|nr:leucine-rich repeat domain-containing protein [Eisenibacter elegans]
MEQHPTVAVLAAALSDTHTLVYTRKDCRSLPEELGSLQGLRLLNVSYNRLKTLPESLGALLELESLDISNNYFRNHLPAVVYRLERLRVLDVRFNKIRQLSEDIVQLQALESINLRSNELVELPQALGHLPELRAIDLQGNHLLDLSQMCLVLASLPQAFSLDLSNCHIQQLPDEFKRLRNLSHLNLSHNTSLDVEHSIELLSQLPQLRSLDLHNTCKSLPLNIAKLRALETLRFDQFGAHTDEVAKLPRLKHLIADHCGFQQLPEWVCRLETLETLDLSHNQLRHLPDSLRHCSQLRRLNLAHNLFEELPRCLMYLPLVLEGLSLDDNKPLNVRVHKRFLNKLYRMADNRPALRQWAFALWMGNLEIEHLPPLTCADLLPLMDLDFPYFQAGLDWLGHLIQPPTPWPTPDSGAVLYVVGQFRRFSAKALKQFLKQQGYTLSHQLSPKVTHVLAGGRVSATIQEALYKMPHLPIFLEYRITKAIDQAGFWQPLDDNASEKIQAFFDSNQAVNIRIGLQLLQPYRLPSKRCLDVLTYTFFSNDPLIRKEALKLFWRCYDAETQYQLMGYFNASKQQNKAFQRAGRRSLMEWVLREAQLDSLYFVERLYQVAHWGGDYILHVGGRFFDKVLQDKTAQSYEGTLFLQAIEYPLAEEMRAHPQITRLEILGGKPEAVLAPQGPVFSLPNLTYLRIEGNEFKDVPEQIGQLQGLNKLRIAETQLTHLPQNILQLASLEELSIYNNQLAHLPQNIGQLSQLRMIWAFSNQLQALPSSIGQLHKLQRLQLDWNQLQSLPEEIGELSQLVYLQLSWNQLSTLPESIGQLQYLEELTLLGNPIQQLPQSLLQLKSLRLLELSREIPMPLEERKAWLKAFETHLPQCKLTFRLV